MSRPTLKQLGWQARRIRILATFDEWDWLDRKAFLENADLSSILGATIRLAIQRERDGEHVDLTPLGEAALDKTPQLSSRVITEWGRTE